MLFFFLIIRLPPRSTLFPSPTLFRSGANAVQLLLMIGALSLVPAALFTLTGFTRILIVLGFIRRSEEHTSELESRQYLVCRLLLEKKIQHKKSTLHPHRRHFISAAQY